MRWTLLMDAALKCQQAKEESETLLHTPSGSLLDRVASVRRHSIANTISTPLQHNPSLFTLMRDQLDGPGMSREVKDVQGRRVTIVSRSSSADRPESLLRTVSSDSSVL